MTTVLAGKLGEQYACKLLQKRGYKIVTTNFRSPYGEIDIVALDKDTLVFVEVKTRWSNRFGAPEEAVTPSKLKSITRTGEYFKLKHSDYPDALRVDVVALEVDDKNITAVRLLRNVTF